MGTGQNFGLCVLEKLVQTLPDSQGAQDGQVDVHSTWDTAQSCCICGIRTHCSLPYLTWTQKPVPKNSFFAQKDTTCTTEHQGYPWGFHPPGRRGMCVVKHRCLSARGGRGCPSAGF